MTERDPHPASAELARSGIEALGAALADGRLTCVAATGALLERIGAIDTPDSTVALRSVLAVADDAMEVAGLSDRERSAGRIRGPLHGIPVLVKDNIEAAGLPATAGSRALLDRPVTADAPVVARLRRAGAVIIGSTNLSEWANFRSPRSISGWSAVGGLTGNPWALDRSAGGSSSGSGAAVAAGLAPLAIGTETNGSITCPAALNGVVGLKPTVGSVPAEHVVPIAASQDVPGPLARSVREVAIAYEVMSGRNDVVAACTPDAAASARVGIADAWLSGDSGTDALFAEAIARLTPVVAAVGRASVPGLHPQVMADQTVVLVHEMRSDLDAYLSRRGGDGVRSVPELVAFNEAHAGAELRYFGQEYLEWAARTGGRADDAYSEARRRNVEFARDACLGPALDIWDVLLAPAYRPAWKSDLVHGDQVGGGGDICTPSAILGLPILTVPMGTVDGLPVGLSLTGPAGSEALLVAVGHAVEAALGLAGTAASSPAWRPAMRG